MKLLLASHNPHKTREFRELLKKEFLIDDLNSFPQIKVAEETGATFVENATLKAVSVSEHQNSFTIADDSGLEVDALGGAPGIYSARYAGEKASDQENVTKLLRELKAATSRSARFCCIIALARAGKLLGTFEGTVEGEIVNRPRGTNGFGYDPVFEPNGFEQTFAEMASGLKNEISHRAKAIAALREGLRKIED
ncbi:MAG TPA: RdgB/HAM1 family non-canonical purine NTP pyrophosphatase [Chthoniobacterales bacterium]|nr:RdgB/HAM1 family non-canonical purine NTP pyrophosphatase [Chthoniobacterales bacterium]